MDELPSRPGLGRAFLTLACGFLLVFAAMWLVVMLAIRPGNIGITPVSLLAACVLAPMATGGFVLWVLDLFFPLTLAAAVLRRRGRRGGVLMLGVQLGVASAAAGAAAFWGAEAAAIGAGVRSWTRIGAAMLAAYFVAAVGAPVALLAVSGARERRRAALT